MTFVAIFAMAVFAGVAGSMVGVGGGIVVVPMLTLVFGAPMKVAIADQSHLRDRHLLGRADRVRHQGA